MNMLHGKGAIQGVVAGTLGVLLGVIAPQPWGGMILWSLVSLVGMRGTWIVIHRTTMYASAVGGALMTVASLGVVIAVAAGYRFPAFPVAIAIPVFGLFGAGFVATLAARRLYPDQVRRILEHMQGSRFSAWDLFLMRNIPDLRHPG